MHRNAKLILRLISSILVCVVVFLAFSVSIIQLFGFEVYGVLTGSMEPEYPIGSLIYVKKIDTSKLQVGDTISFNLSENVIATHRIVELVADENDPSIIRYRTKGDANSAADSSLVDVEDIIGKVVFCLPKMGYFLNYIQSPTGIATTVLVSILLVLLVFVSEMLTSNSDNKLFRKVRGFFTGNLAPEPPRRGGDRRPTRRYEDDHRPQQRPRSRDYDYDDRPRRPAYDRYEDDYRPQRSRSPRYEDDYRRPARRYEDDYRPQQRPRSRDYDDYQPRRSSSGAARSGYSTRSAPRSRDYDYGASPRRSSDRYSSASSRTSRSSEPARRSRYTDDYR